MQEFLRSQKMEAEEVKSIERRESRDNGKRENNDIEKLGDSKSAQKKENNESGEPFRLKTWEEVKSQLLPVDLVKSAKMIVEDEIEEEKEEEEEIDKAGVGVKERTETKKQNDKDEETEETESESKSSPGTRATAPTSSPSGRSRASPWPRPLTATSPPPLERSR